MSVRFLASNGIKVLLLLPIIFGASETVKTLCLAGLLLSLVVDFMFYRRDKAAFEDEDETRMQHVPLPPARSQRRER